MSYHSSSVFVMCLVAIGLSAYSVYVKQQGENYEALCDINQHVSCSSVFKSDYGKGFGISALPDTLKFSNGIYGIAFYSLIALLCFTKNPRLVNFQLFLSILSIIASIYLAYILFFILKDICVVCITTYVLNIANTALICKRLRIIKKMKLNKSE